METTRKMTQIAITRLPVRVKFLTTLTKWRLMRVTKWKLTRMEKLTQRKLL